MDRHGAGPCGWDITFSPGATSHSQRSSPADAVVVCEAESLSLTHEDGTRLTGDEVDRGTQAVQFYCDSNNGDALRAPGVSPQGTAYGNYIRNSTASTYVNCACGSPYRTWSIDVNASGVPYDGSNVIYRVTPGNGAWQYGPSIGITTYGTLATQSGTMSTSSYITAIASVYYKGQTLLENIQSQAP